MVTKKENSWKRGIFLKILVFPLTFEIFGIFQKKMIGWKALIESFHLIS